MYWKLWYKQLNNNSKCTEKEEEFEGLTNSKICQTKISNWTKQFSWETCKIIEVKNPHALLIQKKKILDFDKIGFYVEKKAKKELKFQAKQKLPNHSESPILTSSFLPSHPRMQNNILPPSFKPSRFYFPFIYFSVFCFRFYPSDRRKARHTSITARQTGETSFPRG